MRKNEAKWVESRQRWQINVQDDGERRTFASSIPYRPDKKIQPGKIEAEKKADKWLEERLIGENTRCTVMLDKYFARVEKATGTSNTRQIEGHIRNWIKPAIGAKRIGRLTKNDLQNIIDQAYASGRLSERSLRGLRGTVMAFLAFCQDAQATKLFVRKLVIPAGARRSEKTIVGQDELKKLFSTSTTLRYGKSVEDWYINAYRFIVVTGLRPGEAIGLEWQNIDGDTVTLTKSINDYKEVTQGKNKNALRSFKLDDYGQQIINAQRTLLNQHGIVGRWVFPDKESLENTQQFQLRSAWKRYCEGNGITSGTTPYELRHTFVSLNDEMPGALKKMLLGHSKNMDTDGTYSHKKQGDMDKAAAYVTSALKSVLES